MAQTELLNSISKSIDYPVEQNLSASYHCGTFSLIVDTDLWTEQMYYELPWIQLDIYITVGGIDIKYLSCNIMLDTDEPKKPYSVSVYEIPGSFKVKLTPGFDDNVITTHNELCLQEDISNTWGPQTLEFPCSVVWDDSNISSSSSVTPADLCTYTIIRSTDSNYAAIYKLQQTKNSISTFVGNTINIPKDMVIQSGTVETCEHNDVPIIGYVVGDKYLDLIISNSSNEHIYILLNDLVDLSASNISYNNSNSGLDSTNVNNAIDELSSKKVDKEIGKVLSSNDYTTFEKNKLNEIEIGAEVNVQSDWTQTDSSSDDFIKNKPTNLSQFTNDYEFITNDTSSLTNYYKKSDTLSTVEINGILEDKVDKITGKGLSTNDYTTAEKTKLAGIEEEANKTVIDDTLDDSSTNPVQNKVVKAALDTNKNNISSIQQEQIVQNADIATLRLALNTKIYGIRIDKQDANPDTRVTYLYDAVGMTPAYMDFNSGSFNYGSWADIWFIKNNRPIALKFDGTVDYELDHTDFTKKFDGTTSDVSDPNYGGNFMSKMPTVYVKRWEDSRYNYIAFSDKQVNSDFLAQAHTNANGTVNSAIYLPMFKGWKDSNNKLRSLMGTYPTGNTAATNEVTYASNNGTGWQIWDKAKIDLLMDLIMLITKSTNCRAKIGNGNCATYNASDTTNYGKMKSGYETDGTTRSASAQFYGSEGTDVTNYGKHHMIAFYIEDLWGNRWDRCLGFNLVDNIYKVKMTPPYVLNSDSTYQSLSVTPPSSTEGWLTNVSSGVYGDVPTEVGASSTSGFANYFYKNASGNRLSLFGGGASSGLEVGRRWSLYGDSGSSGWSIGGSPCYTAL